MIEARAAGNSPAGDGTPLSQVRREGTFATFRRAVAIGLGAARRRPVPPGPPIEEKDFR